MTAPREVPMDERLAICQQAQRTLELQLAAERENSKRLEINWQSEMRGREAAQAEQGRLFVERDRQFKRAAALEIERDELLNLAEAAWGVISNVSFGDWAEQPNQWTDAAVRWRERYHGALKAKI